jgi:hypothetical protein
MVNSKHRITEKKKRQKLIRIDVTVPAERNFTKWKKKGSKNTIIEV